MFADLQSPVKITSTPTASRLSILQQNVVSNYNAQKLICQYFSTEHLLIKHKHNKYFQDTVTNDISVCC